MSEKKFKLLKNTRTFMLENPEVPMKINRSGIEIPAGTEIVVRNESTRLLNHELQKVYEVHFSLNGNRYRQFILAEEQLH